MKIKEKFVGYSKSIVDENNYFFMPTFTRAHVGDRFVLVPDNDEIDMYSMNEIQSYFEKIETLKDDDKLTFAREMKDFCEHVIVDAIVDENNRICLSSNISVIDNTVEITGSGNKLIISGDFRYNESLIRNKKQA